MGVISISGTATRLLPTITMCRGVADRAPLANEVTAGITAGTRSQSHAVTAPTQFSPVGVVFARIAAMQRPKFRQSLRLLVPAYKCVRNSESEPHGESTDDLISAAKPMFHDEF
jgi:hypothetical protein